MPEDGACRRSVCQEVSRCRAAVPVCGDVAGQGVGDDGVDGGGAGGRVRRMMMCRGAVCG